MSAPLMHNHGVMEEKGAYNRHARIPAGGAALALPRLEEAARKLELGSGDEPLVVADYGSSQGKNSLGPMQAVIRTMRGPLSSNRAIFVFHIDQPTNDLLPDGAPRPDTRMAGEADATGLSAFDAIRTHSFLLMVCAFFLVSASVQGCVVQMAAMLTDRGLTIQNAALGSSLLGAALLVGRVGTGYLLDRFFAPHLAAVSFGGAGAGIGLLWISTSAVTVLVGAFLVGLGLGAEVDIIAYLVSRYFGLRYFGQIYGVAFGAFLLAGALGPLVMGEGFDLMGSYNAPLAALFLSTMIAAFLMTQLGPYRYLPGHPKENEQIVQAEAK
jgi:hypothetical protein